MTAAHDTQALTDSALDAVISATMNGCWRAYEHDDVRAILRAALASLLQEQEGQPARVTPEMVTSQEAAVSEVEGICERLSALKGRLATLAAGSQAVQVPGWRPIESAPKDGSQIDAWIGDEREPDVFWGTPKLGHRAPCWCRHAYDSYFGWIPESVGMPSHWMPKPQQPLAGGEVGK